MRRGASSIILGSLLALGSAAAAAAWQPPVKGPVTEDWRPPANRYASGNRGVDFAPAPGVAVGSSGDGVVSFAGQVGGVLYVVVDHAGGLRTTYGDLASISVSKGQTVGSGQEVGKSGAHLHFGVRRNGEYVDPNSLFGRVHLVPVE